MGKLINRMLVISIIWSMLFSNVVQASPLTNIRDKNNFTDKANAYLKVLEKDKRFSGVILVTKDGKPIYEKACGMANYELSVPNTMNMKFEIGSMTKQFTAASIMMLVEQKKLDLQDPINKYIIDYPDGDKITIHHLLTHTSGIPNYLDDPNFNPKKFYSTEDLIATFKDKPLNFKTGDTFQYSNSNYVLLGYIIEKISNQPYEEFITSNIINPLGLTNTGFVHDSPIVKNRASGYEFVKGSLENAMYYDKSLSYATGDLYSDVYDLAKWHQALFSNKLLTDSSVEKMITGYQKKDDTTFYGYGLAVQDHNGKKCAFHDGETWGFTSLMTRYLDDKIDIIVLSNVSSYGIYDISDDLTHMIFNEKYNMPQAINPINLSNDELDAIVGTYQNESGLQVIVTKEGNNLFATLTNMDTNRMYTITKQKFLLKEQGMGIEFKNLQNGKYTNLEVSGFELKRID